MFRVGRHLASRCGHGPPHGPVRGAMTPPESRTSLSASKVTPATSSRCFPASGSGTAQPSRRRCATRHGMGGVAWVERSAARVVGRRDRTTSAPPVGRSEVPVARGLRGFGRLGPRTKLPAQEVGRTLAKPPAHPLSNHLPADARKETREGVNASSRPKSLACSNCRPGSHSKQFARAVPTTRHSLAPRAEPHQTRDGSSHPRQLRVAHSAG